MTKILSQPLFLPIVNEIQDHNIDLILENGQKWVEIDAV